MTSENDELLTLSEVAVYLKLAEKTIHRMVQKGEIPCFKVASQWRFSKRMVDQWLNSKLNTPPKDEISHLLETEPELVPFTRMSSPEMFVENMDPGTKEDVLQQLIQPLVAQGYIDQGTDFLNRLLERESMISTAVGNGIALPHIRNPKQYANAVPAVVVGRCQAGVEFDSLDGSPTYLFFLIFSTNITVHLRITSRINRILMNKNLIHQLVEAKTKEEMFSLLSGEDMEITRLEKEKKNKQN